MTRRDFKLSPNQRQILLASEDGSSLRVIAHRLGLTKSVVGSRLSQVYIRLDVSHLDQDERRAAALRVARRHKLIPAKATTDA